MMTRNLLAAIVACGILAGCAGGSTAPDDAPEVPEPSDIVTGAAGNVLIPADTMQQRRVRAYAGAAILARVAADRAAREPGNQAAVHSALMALERSLEEEVSDAWPNLALRDVRVRLYEAMLSGTRQRITDYITGVLTPSTVLGGLKEAGLDISTYAAMQSDVACHFAGLTDAPEGAADECPVAQPTERSLDELRSIYRAMLVQQRERVEGMVGA